MLNNSNDYEIDINKIIERLEFYNIQYIKENKYQYINLNVQDKINGDSITNPYFEIEIENNNILETKIADNNFDVNNDYYTYSINVHLIPKKQGNTNIKITFKEYQTEKVIDTFNYSIIINDALEVEYRKK